MASYADQHKTTSLNGFKARLPDYERPPGRIPTLHRCLLDHTVSSSSQTRLRWEEASIFAAHFQPIHVRRQVSPG